MFESILNDPYINSLFEEISKVEITNEFWAHHGKTHTLSVVITVERIMELLNCDERTIELGKIAAILHDIGNIKGKKDHATLSFQLAKEYLDKNSVLNEELSPDEKEKILNAIKNHSDGVVENNLITDVLLLADKIDLTKDRVTQKGYSIEGIRQYQYIDSIMINIKNNEFIVNFTTDNKFNKEEFENFYFTEKVTLSIKKLAISNNLEPIVLLNGENWSTLIKK